MQLRQHEPKPPCPEATGPAPNHLHRLAQPREVRSPPETQGSRPEGAICSRPDSCPAQASPSCPATPVLGPAASRAGQRPSRPFLGSVTHPTSNLNLSGLRCQLPPSRAAEASAELIGLSRCLPPWGDTHPTTTCSANPKPHQGPASNDWATSHPGHMLHLLPDFPWDPLLAAQICVPAPKDLMDPDLAAVPRCSPEQSFPQPHSKLPKPSGHKCCRSTLCWHSKPSTTTSTPRRRLPLLSASSSVGSRENPATLH